MKRKKISLANIQEKLSRAEMKQILAGDAPEEGRQCWEYYGYPPDPGWFCANGKECKFKDGKPGTCLGSSNGSHCYCATGTA